MKEKVLSLGLSFLLLFILSANAQNDQEPIRVEKRLNIISMHPLGFINKLRLSYERFIHDMVGTGVIGSYYYGRFPGAQLAPFVRIYPNGESPGGLFVTVKGIVGFHSPELTYYPVIENEPHLLSSITFRQKSPFFMGGGGFGIGYRWLFGQQNNIAMDLSIGFKAVTPVPTFEEIRNGRRYRTANVDWYFTGPGSVFDGMFAFGIVF